MTFLLLLSLSSQERVQVVDPLEVESVGTQDPNEGPVCGRSCSRTIVMRLLLALEKDQGFF